MSTSSGLSTEDLASNLLGAKGGGGLEACFAPQNIAVIGATEKAGSIGRTQSTRCGADRAGAEELIASVHASGRPLLTETESKRLLELYRIPTVWAQVALTEEQAVTLAAGPWWCGSTRNCLRIPFTCASSSP